MSTVAKAGSSPKVDGKGTWFRRIMANFRPAEGQSLIWWLVEKQNVWWKQVFAFFGFIIMFRLFSFTPQQALIMVVCMYLHERGHAHCFRANGIDHYTLFIFPLGAAAIPANQAENERSDQLPWYLLGVLLLAGPAVNVALMVIGRLTVNFGVIDSLISVGNDLIYINGLLAFMNLIPIWKVDGGQLFKLIYSSLSERHDRVLTLSLTISAAVISVYLLGSFGWYSLNHLLVGYFTNWSVITFAVIFVMCAWYTQGKDDPLHAKSPQRMTRIQLGVIFTAFFGLVVIGMAAIGPFMI